MGLTVSGLHAHYGKSHVLRGVSFDLPAQSIVSLVGRNGSGRSTTLKSILGIVRPTQGSVVLDGVEQELRDSLESFHGGDLRSFVAGKGYLSAPTTPPRPPG